MTSTLDKGIRETTITLIQTFASLAVVNSGVSSDRTIPLEVLGPPSDSGELGEPLGLGVAWTTGETEDEDGRSSPCSGDAVLEGRGDLGGSLDGTRSRDSFGRSSRVLGTFRILRNTR